MGRAGDADIDAELARDSTDAGRRHAAACRAAVPNAEHKAAAWRLLTGSAEYGLEETVEVGLSFNRVEHAGLLAGYAEQYFEQLPKTWAARDGMLRILVGRVLFPYSAASPTLLTQIDEFLAEADRDPGLIRCVIEGRDVVERALRSRSLDS
jgi:aminopeptidase N